MYPLPDRVHCPLRGGHSTRDTNPNGSPRVSSANAVADNIDYDDIKHFIKENTTPGQGKSISVPGRGDDKLAEFENALFHILADQHQRIDLFVKSKAGEIQRRLGEFLSCAMRGARMR